MRTSLNIGRVAFHLTDDDAQVTAGPDNRGRRIRFTLEVTNGESRSIIILGADQTLKTEQGQTYAAVEAKVHVAALGKTRVTLTFVVPQDAVPVSLTLRIGKRTRLVELSI